MPAPLRLAVVLLLSVVTAAAAGPRPAPPSAAWLLDQVAALTAPPMEGRRSGTTGGELAARHIAGVLAAAGLRGAGDDGSFFQSFGLGSTLALPRDAGANALMLDDRPLALVAGRDWTPHGGSPVGEVAGSLTFVGHALEVPEQGYDDWAGQDVRGRIVIALAGAPRHLTGVSSSRLDKLVAARARGASGLILVDDPLPSLAASATRFDLPSATVTPATADALLAPTGRTVVELAGAIVRDQRPASAATATRLRLRIGLERVEQRVANVIGILPGTDPLLARDAVVLGAHYDHLGRVGGMLYPGADDNASGTAVVLGLARSLAAAGGTPRTLIFALFAAEELGLIGSRHYVSHPVVPIERTVAMLNFDMVGRLRNDRLSVGGVDSGSGLRALVAGAAAREGLDLSERAAPGAASDHARFYQAGVPVLFFFTGMHDDYHGPGDTADRINGPGLARVASVALGVIEPLAQGPRPVYAALPRPERRSPRSAGGGPFFGIAANGRGEADGVHVASVVPGSTAARLGVAAGDVIVRFAGVPVATFDEFQGAVRARRPGERISVVFLRDGQARTGSETLDARP